jgi:hypothetical protein
MKPKKVAATIAIAGALGFSALGLGVGAATASANPAECGGYCHVDYHDDRGGGGYGGYNGDGGGYRGDDGFRGDGRYRGYDGYDGYGGYGYGPDIPFFCIPFVNCPA